MELEKLFNQQFLYDFSFFNFVLSVNEDQLPTYGVYAGWGGAILILAFSIGSIFGLLPEGAFILIAVLGGVVLFPAFIFSFSSAFSKA